MAGFIRNFTNCNSPRERAGRRPDLEARRLVAFLALREILTTKQALESQLQLASPILPDHRLTLRSAMEFSQRENCHHYERKLKRAKARAPKMDSTRAAPVENIHRQCPRSPCQPRDSCDHEPTTQTADGRGGQAQCPADQYQPPCHIHSPPTHK